MKKRFALIFDNDEELGHMANIFAYGSEKRQFINGVEIDFYPVLLNDSRDIPSLQDDLYRNGEIFLYMFDLRGKKSFIQIDSYFQQTKNKIEALRINEGGKKYVNFLVGLTNTEKLEKDNTNVLLLSNHQKKQLIRNINGLKYFDIDFQDHSQIEDLLRETISFSADCIPCYYSKYVNDKKLEYGINNDEAIVVDSSVVLENNLTIPAFLKQFFTKIFIKGIDNGAFLQCNLITSIDFEKESKLTTIGSTCFPSSLRLLSLPSSIQYLKAGWSRGLIDYMDVKVGKEPFLLHLDILYTSDFSQIRYLPEGSKSLTISSKIHIFGNSLLKGIKNLTNKLVPLFLQIETSSDKSKCFHFEENEVLCFKKLILPSNMISFGSKKIFNSYYCLQEIAFEDNDSKNSNYSCFEGCIYDKSFKKLIYVPKNKFLLTIHKLTEEIEEYAASNSKVKHVYFEHSNKSCLTTIGEVAFSQCIDLESFETNSNVKKIGFGAFDGCKNLREINLSFSNEIEIAKNAFDQCNNFLLVINENTKISSEKMISENHIQRKSNEELVKVKEYLVQKVEEIPLQKEEELPQHAINESFQQKAEEIHDLKESVKNNQIKENKKIYIYNIIEEKNNNRINFGYKNTNNFTKIVGGSFNRVIVIEIIDDITFNEEEEEFEHFDFYGIDKYNKLVIDKCIGTYSNGKYFEIIDKISNIHYTLKTASNPKFEQVKKLLKEYEVISSIQHPSIERYSGFIFPIDEKKNCSILSEFCPFSLKTLVDEKLINEFLITRIIIEICFGLDFLLNKFNVMHQNLNLEAIKLTAKKHVRISGFEYLKIIKIDQLFISKGIGIISYMSPEKIKEEPSNFKSDVYSFGILLHYLIFECFPAISLPKLHGDSDKISIDEKLIKTYNVNGFCVNLIKKCCSFFSNERPTYEEILNSIQQNDFQLFETKIQENELFKIKKRFAYLAQINRDTK